MELYVVSNDMLAVVAAVVATKWVEPKGCCPAAGRGTQSDKTINCIPLCAYDHLGIGDRSLRVVLQEIRTLWLQVKEGMRRPEAYGSGSQAEGPVDEPHLTNNIAFACSLYLSLSQLVHRLVAIDGSPCCHTGPES